MEPVYLFDLVNQNRSWLSVRQTLGAQNVANANTPGYVARDVAPFAQVLDKAGLELAGAHPSHIKIGASGTRVDSSRQADGWEITHSGNSVALEQEMIKLANTKGAFALDTSILKAFHSMWISSLKG